MKIEFNIDPNERMDLVPINPACPANLRFVVRWLKGLAIFQNTDLTADRAKVLLILHETINSPHWPAGTIWPFEMSKARVALIYDRACEWIFSQETF